SNEAHDCPVAQRRIRRVNPSAHMLGDKAYDSAELRDELDERGTKPVISGLQASIITCGHVSSRAGAGSPCATIGPESATPYATGDCRRAGGAAVSLRP